MDWWAVTYLDNNRSLHDLHVLAATNHPAHLFMAWAKVPPARRPRYVNIRGKSVRCGWTYIWDTPTIVEQAQALDTFEHLFPSFQLASTDHVWYYLFSTRTPAYRACQSFLYHVYPPEAHTWTSKMYVGTKLKGIFYTDNFTGPGGDHPTWTMANFGLHSTHIHQLEPDPFSLAYRLYAIAGGAGDRTLYVRIPAFWPTWTPLLTDAEAITLTGSTGGSMTWISPNLYFPGHLYVLFNSSLTDNGIWCIRSLDYGETWTAHQIYTGILNYEAGNLSVGLLQGDSPYDPGTTLYAALCSHLFAPATLWLSLNHGQTWTRRDSIGFTRQIPLCLVDPTDQATVYLGAYIHVDHTHELYRSHTHGSNLAEADGPLHLGPMLYPFHGTLWVNPTDPAFLIALSGNHLFFTIDNCATWVDTGAIAQSVKRFALTWENPDRFYLARNVSGAPGPGYPPCHTIFASEDYGATVYGKSGANACHPTGAGDSIPYNCGGVCLQGIQLFPPY